MQLLQLTRKILATSIFIPALAFASDIGNIFEQTGVGNIQRQSDTFNAAVGGNIELFDTLNTGVDPLMGWETSKDTMSEVKLHFSTRDEAINYAKKNNIDYYIVEPQKRKIIKKSYADNFLKK